MVNSMTDLGGTRKARPGISAWSGFPTVIPNEFAVEAMCVYGTQLIYITSDRRFWSCDGAGAVTALSDGTTATSLLGTSRPQMLSLRTKVVAVGGDAPQATDGTTVSYLLAGTPPDANTIAGIATRIVLGVNDSSGRFRWSDQGDSGHSTWDPLNYAEAEASPDDLQRVDTNTNELFAFGTQTLQVYSPDASVDFASGRALNIGLIAPYSVVNVDDQFAFLDRERRFVLTDGRSFSDETSVLSKPIEASLRNLSTVDDCWGFRMRTDRWDAVVWFFPTDGKGYLWNRRNRGWSEWRAWGTNGYTAPNITSALFWPENNVFLVGLSTGQIAKLDAAAYTDLGDTIKVELVSGFVDRGTNNRKKSTCATFVFKRGQTAQTGTAPVVAISWRDDTGPYCAPVMRTLGLAGDYDPVVDIRSSGVYRQRQWRVEYTSDAEFTFVGAKEEFVVLSN